MSRESDLLFGLLALQMNFLSKEHLLEGAAVWMNDPKSDLPKLLLDRTFIKPSQHAVVKALVEEQLKLHGGDADRSLVAAPVDRGIRDGLLRLKPPAEVERSLVAMKPTDAGAQTVIVAPPSPDRYRLGAEIARGGLGRVMEAFDATLGRNVAVKLVLDDLPPDLAERFEREAKLTARLEHPNIVPIHDFGTLLKGRQLFLSMKRIRGRDLGKLLRSIADGDNDARRMYSRPRLLRMFQDICLGMAFAHDHGVIHRDLKPANIMIGDYGETLIVDWGLARELGSGVRAQGSAGGKPAPSLNHEPPALSPDLTPDLTMDGEVLGTPAYMAPEQAAGQIHEMDHRSDIYSLGAILYEILTLHPPIEGKTVVEIIGKVRSGRITLPSQKVRNGAPGRGREDAEGTVVKGLSPYVAVDAIPQELDAICLKALAFRRGDRYQTATELHDEIQLFLEGVKERERAHVAAEEAVARAKAAMERLAHLKEEVKVAAEEAKEAAKRVQPWDADKSVLWAAEDRAKALEREGIEAFSAANAALTLALGHQRDHAEARRLKAELFWRKYLEAEELGDEKEMLLHRRVVEQFNDGLLDAQLKGDGTLTVRTRAYPCRCLLDGRMVRPEELAWTGYHPFSGRALDGHKGGEGLPELEPKEPVRLKVHGRSCAPEAVQGAEVWLYRYEEIGRRLTPVTPDGFADAGNRPIPASVVDATFEKSSPFRPQGPGVWLGRTPIQTRVLPMGSYLLVVSHQGRAPMRVPVFVARCGHWEQDVTLFDPEEIPAGFIPIPAGPFGYQGDPENPYAGPAETKAVDDVFIARHPVTCREYCEFLNDLAKTDPAQAARHVPRQAEEAGFYWPGPWYAVPTTAWLATAPPEAKAKAKRLQNSPVDWDDDWPVFGVSWEDGMAFAAWKRRKQATLTMLPHELEWEKSARGPDRRYYPWGRHWDDRWANGNRSNSGGARPVRVEEFVSDESPYGVRGLGGNSRDACLKDTGPEYPGWRLFRGGNWATAGLFSRPMNRSSNTARNAYYINGVREACAVRLSSTLRT